MTSSRIRARTVVLGLSSIYIVLLVRLATLQLIRYPSLSSKAKDQHFFKVVLEPRRGDILDRCGRPIALSIERRSAYAHPYKLKDKKKAAELLSSVLNMDKKEILQKFFDDSPFVWVKRKVERNEYIAIKNLNLDGIGFIEESKRYYPQGSLGANAVGFAGIDNRGLEGIEKRFDSLLSGFPGEYRAIRDARGKEISSCIFKLIKPVEGASLYLTIDNVIQNIVEESLFETVERKRARGGAAVVVDPRSGEILAMASYPTFDPNVFASYPKESYRNNATSLVYEPGSTFKAITASAALEEKLFKTTDTIYCENGEIKIASHIIHDHDPYGILTFSETVEKSSNIGLLKIGQKVGSKKLYGYIKDFGFGSRIGLDLYGEENGIIPPLRLWKPITLVTVSFGQGIATTPIQMVSAYSAIANGGILNRPYIVKKVIGPEGVSFRNSFSGEGKRIISVETSFRMREIMRKAVESGTGTRAKIKGLDIAGKTGTAQKVSPQGGYCEDKYIASFIGFFPADSPEIIIGIFIDEPQGIYYGGSVAAPCFREAAEKIIGYRKISTPDEKIYMSWSLNIGNMARD